jgi:uncharacterized repeat protein (TIGR03803 family)
MPLTFTNRGVKGCWDILAVGPRFGSTKLAAAITRGVLTLAVFSALLLIALQPARAQTETVLHSFLGSTGDGQNPYYGTLIRDKNGNLYGTTLFGGSYGSSCGGGGCGTVFKLTARGKEKILHSFDENGTDGYYPYGGLVIDSKGNLYGTTFFGGAYSGGTVFKVTPAGKETILHNFDANANGDGGNPYAGMVMDANGNLYGTTFTGGHNGGGTVFKVTPSETETILYSFDPNGIDGYSPTGGLAIDTSGNLYGMTQFGGLYEDGTVFKVTSSGAETILHNFLGSPSDGASPLYATPVLDTSGNLYGATHNGGLYGYGAVFELTFAGTVTILHNFDSNGDGYYPYGGLALDTKGNLYGTTPLGGAYGEGTVYELAPSRVETILHSFDPSEADGYGPQAGVVLDTKGNLYGTTMDGGTHNYGTVFKVTP